MGRYSKVYTTGAEKLKDFAIGFALYFFGNIAAWWLLLGPMDYLVRQFLSMDVATYGLLGLGVAGLLFFGGRRDWIAMGGLAAIAIFIINGLARMLWLFTTCGTRY